MHGWGEFSPVVSILAATIPEQTGEPMTTVDGINVKFTWTAPLNTGGNKVQITSYEV